jgi:quinol-cytochrome oxidoreductase complex cytochrome b subunit
MFSKTNKAILISACLSSLISLALNFFPATIIYSKFWFLSVAFHALTSFILHFLLFRKTADPRDNTFKIMFASMGRLLLCMVALLIYKVCDKQNFTQFALHFMTHYILFTVFEIAYLLKFIKTQKND